MYKFNIRREGKMVIDISAIMFCFVLGTFIRYGDSWHEKFSEGHLGIYMIAFLTLYILMDIQNKSWRYTSIMEVAEVIFINTLPGVIVIGTSLLLGNKISLTIIVMTITLGIVIQLLGRYIFRVKRHMSTRGRGKSNRRETTLVIGAGEAGESIARESKINPNFKYNIIGYLDADSKKWGVSLHGYKVFGNRDLIPEMLEDWDIKNVIIAIPSADSKTIKSLRDYFVGTDIKIKVLPPIDKFLNDENTTNQLRDVKIEDLLGRKEININNTHLVKVVEGKTVFVTGGAGSIGSELARQIGKYKPSKLVAIDVNENDLYFLSLELKRKIKDLEFITEVCNVRDEKKIEWLFDKYRPEVVFHAAAHKHVPLMEHNPEEAIKNNIFGTKNVADMADKYGTERFVLVSTDKAVNPTNVMGATKRACEIVIQERAKTSKTKYMAVRFGNVLGSNGSVIPIFKKLIEEEKNITLTHPDITRYFMTIPEAAQLVMEAGYLGTGGEVFVLDMGEPIKIIDLAKNLIDLSGSDVGIDIVGLRPGEKLYEELLYDVSAATKTENDMIFISKLTDGEDVDLDRHLGILEREVEQPNVEILKSVMKDFVSTYKEPEHHFTGAYNQVKNIKARKEVKADVS